MGLYTNDPRKQVMYYPNFTTVDKPIETDLAEKLEESRKEVSTIEAKLAEIKHAERKYLSSPLNLFSLYITKLKEEYLKYKKNSNAFSEECITVFKETNKKNLQEALNRLLLIVDLEKKIEIEKKEYQKLLDEFKNYCNEFN